MSGADLIRMANQIAANFGPFSEAQAVAETARHINRFWEPRMRTELKRLIAQGQAEDLGPIAAKAMDRV